jgi:nicotinamide riboside transporter PnuC
MKWPLVLCVLLGDYLNVCKKWQGFLLWIICDGSFCYINASQGDYEEAFVFAFYTIFAIIGIIKWKFVDVAS